MTLDRLAEFGDAWRRKDLDAVTARCAPPPAPPTGLQRLWHDSDHDGVPLGHLERLCEVLDLDPAELFAPTAAASRRSRATRGRGDGPLADDRLDVAILEAALATIAGHADPVTNADDAATPVSRVRLAHALDWPPGLGASSVRTAARSC